MPELAQPVHAILRRVPAMSAPMIGPIEASCDARRYRSRGGQCLVGAGTEAPSA